MKEVKAYIKHQRVNQVIEALEREGFTDMTLIDVRGITSGLHEEAYKYSLELAQKYMDVIKLELVCADGQAKKAAAIIAQAAHTGRQGDGLVFVTPVEAIVRIKTGEKGNAAMEPEK
ncbi:MAG: P-II family nitrogen regulator [Nitrospirae bacterium]|nr:P-II family nitrogen regulator [Candidatus Manganitrophaceae bacterium]